MGQKPAHAKRIAYFALKRTDSQRIHPHEPRTKLPTPLQRIPFPPNPNPSTRQTESHPAATLNETDPPAAPDPSGSCSKVREHKDGNLRIHEQSIGRQGSHRATAGGYVTRKGGGAHLAGDGGGGGRGAPAPPPPREDLMSLRFDPREVAFLRRRPLKRLLFADVGLPLLLAPSGWKRKTPLVFGTKTNS
jgi:hypothetical protein